MNCEKLPDVKQMAVETVHLDSRHALEAHAEKLSLIAKPGMVILLDGDLGSGKTTYARAFIRSLSTGAAFDIPSPTFTLVQTYDQTRVPVAHIDLYRIGSPSEIHELDLDELAKSYILIIEWPDRLPAMTWPDVLDISISGSGHSRRLTFAPGGRWVQSLDRSRQIDSFIAGSGWRAARRRFLEGDASSRRYEVLENAGPPAILMDMPALPDGPPIKGGKSYSQIAHLAEDINAVIAINGELVDRGFSAPRIYEHDRVRGFAIIEDLGRQVFGRMSREGEDLRLPMLTAVEILAHIASQSWPSKIVKNGFTYEIGRYDLEAQLIEVDLLLSWYWPYQRAAEVPTELREEFIDEWSRVLPLTHPAEPVWTLRDFHSPNLLWLPEREKLKRVGLIDTQDALLGHPAYDLVSLIQDARMDIDDALSAELYEYYCGLRSTGRFDRTEFSAAFAVLGAQRATKILGIFARLFKRDGKQGYLKHLPRVSRYLRNSLGHPALAHLRKWHELHLPGLAGKRHD